MTSKPTTTGDPIEEHVARVNAPERVQRMTAAYQRRWASLEESRAGEDERKAEWAPVAKLMRRRFRAEFAAPTWKELSITFLGSGYAINWATRVTKPYLHYEACWRGIRISREFQPACIADVQAEAWRLGGMLAAWVERPA